jgi:hypothetical protein
MKIPLGILLAAAIGGTALAQPAKTYSKNPTGEGDPAAITCRSPVELEGSRFMGPEVCKNNAEWAQYAKDGMTVSPDGRHDIPIAKKGSCQVVSGAPGGTSNAMSQSSSMKCD